jgi:hypothetical protein
MRISLPFKVLKELYKSPENIEVMGIVHSNDGYLHDRILLSPRKDENGHYACKIDDIVVGTVSFHTHPKICYTIYNTDRGWPSIDDFMALMNEDKMKVLLVIAVEGVYLIIKKKKISSQFMKKMKSHYKQDINKNKTTIEEYIQKTNQACGDCIKIILFTVDTINKEINNKITMDVIN